MLWRGGKALPICLPPWAGGKTGVVPDAPLSTLGEFCFLRSLSPSSPSNGLWMTMESFNVSIHISDSKLNSI